VWAKAEELGVPLFIHPTGIPELAKKLAGNGWLTNAVGYPLETTIALSHLIFEGTFDRFPWQLQPVDHIFASESLSDEHKADILGRTAARLLNFTA
jgi:predicted TIM-barrel fold metal-dependent hydrolase